MLHRLGEFVPQPGSSAYSRLLHDHDRTIADAMRRTYAEMLQVRLEPSVEAGPPDREQFENVKRRMEEALNYEDDETTPLPDLLAADLDGRDASWAHAIHDHLRRLAPTLPLRLLICDFVPGPGGFLSIAATCPTISGSVRIRDRVQPGFAALRDDEGRMRVWPRIFRLVCANGSLVSLEEGDDVLGDSRDVAAAIDRCLDRTAFESALGALRTAAADTLLDPRLMRDETGYITRHYWGAIEEEWEDEGDRTRYGLMNAISAVARDLPDTLERLRLEEAAGRIAWLVRPVPARERELELSIPEA